MDYESNWLNISKYGRFSGCRFDCLSKAGNHSMNQSHPALNCWCSGAGSHCPTQALGFFLLFEGEERRERSHNIIDGYIYIWIYVVQSRIKGLDKVMPLSMPLIPQVLGSTALWQHITAEFGACARYPSKYSTAEPWLNWAEYMKHLLQQNTTSDQQCTDLFIICFGTLWGLLGAARLVSRTISQ